MSRHESGLKDIVGERIAALRAAHQRAWSEAQDPDFTMQGRSIPILDNPATRRSLQM